MPASFIFAGACAAGSAARPSSASLSAPRTGAAVTVARSPLTLIGLASTSRSDFSGCGTVWIMPDARTNGLDSACATSYTGPTGSTPESFASHDAVVARRNT